MQFWVMFWSIVWFAGLGVFSVLSIIVIIFGAGDLLSLLRSLKARQAEAMEDAD